MIVDEIIYPIQPIDYRVVWYSHTPYKLLFERQCTIRNIDLDMEHKEWVTTSHRILDEAPYKVKCLLQEMSDYYDFSMVLELEAQAETN
jgi:hypothetical protein